MQQLNEESLANKAHKNDQLGPTIRAKVNLWTPKTRIILL